MKNNRRQFLKNTSLAALSAAVFPTILKAESPAGDQSVAACDVTTLDYYGQGPFYKANAPLITGNQLAAASEPGDRMIISGRVLNLDCTEVIPDTVIDIWHANDAGGYDNSGFNLRGIVHSNNQGFYLFETIYPGKYLNGSVYRPSHIHFKVTPPGHPTLTTQLYFEGDPDNATDPASSITSGTYNATSRIILLSPNSTGKLEGTWDIVVDGDGQPLGIEDLHRDFGMIYRLSPNPFSSRVEINYGVFRESRINLSVFDLSGRLVAALDDKNLEPGKYTAVWNSPASLPSGYYFVALKVNEMQVHYQKLIKE